MADDGWLWICYSGGYGGWIATCLSCGCSGRAHRWFDRLDLDRFDCDGLVEIAVSSGNGESGEGGERIEL